MSRRPIPQSLESQENKDIPDVFPEQAGQRNASEKNSLPKDAGSLEADIGDVRASPDEVIEVIRDVIKIIRLSTVDKQERLQLIEDTVPWIRDYLKYFGEEIERVLGDLTEEDYEYSKVLCDLENNYRVFRRALLTLAIEKNTINGNVKKLESGEEASNKSYVYFLSGVINEDVLYARLLEGAEKRHVTVPELLMQVYHRDIPTLTPPIFLVTYT